VHTGASADCACLSIPRKKQRAEAVQAADMQASACFMTVQLPHGLPAMCSGISCRDMEDMVPMEQQLLL
jgi:hypothetical protein